MAAIVEMSCLFALVFLMLIEFFLAASAKAQNSVRNIYLESNRRTVFMTGLRFMFIDNGRVARLLIGYTLPLYISIYIMNALQSPSDWSYFRFFSPSLRYSIYLVDIGILIICFGVSATWCWLSSLHSRFRDFIANWLDRSTMGESEFWRTRLFFLCTNRIITLVLGTFCLVVEIALFVLLGQAIIIGPPWFLYS